jgi:Pyruvate/2-oxoacid:ferredoxin oxidoreductase delta subunit
MSEFLGADGTLAAKMVEGNNTATAVQRAVLDATKCSSCGMCVSFCPHHAIEEPMNFCCAKCVKYCMTYEVPCESARIAICVERCDGCGLCIPCCPSDAIHLEPFDP